MSKYIPLLVEPEKARNIGFVARAMKCTGLDELRIVHREWTEMPDGAFVTGVSAIKVLRTAKFFKSVEEALADCEGAVAMSRRTIAQLPYCELQELEEKAPQGNKVAIMFGRESAGLRVDEAQMCQLLCEIKSEEKMSYNLGQAAAITLYSLQKNLMEGQSVNKKNAEEIASFDEKNAFNQFIMGNLSEKVLAKKDVSLFLDKMLREWNPSSVTLKSFFGLIRNISDSPAIQLNQKNEKNKS